LNTITVEFRRLTAPAVASPLCTSPLTAPPHRRVTDNQQTALEQLSDAFLVRQVVLTAEDELHEVRSRNPAGHFPTATFRTERHERPGAKSSRIAVGSSTVPGAACASTSASDIRLTADIQVRVRVQVEHHRVEIRGCRGLQSARVLPPVAFAGDDAAQRFGVRQTDQQAALELP
jgi:hypothetical protein